HPSTPHVNILPIPAAAAFKETNMAWMDQWERAAWVQARTPAFIGTRLSDLLKMLNTFLGSTVLFAPVVFFSGRLVRTPRLRVLFWTLLVSAVAVLIEVKYYEHYAAPLLIVFLILVVEAFRHLRAFKVSGKPVGRFLTFALPSVMLLLYGGTEVTR